MGIIVIGAFAFAFDLLVRYGTAGDPLEGPDLTLGPPLGPPLGPSLGPPLHPLCIRHCASGCA